MSASKRSVDHSGPGGQGSGSGGRNIRARYSESPGYGRGGSSGRSTARDGTSSASSLIPDDLSAASPTGTPAVGETTTLGTPSSTDGSSGNPKSSARDKRTPPTLILAPNIRSQLLAPCNIRFGSMNEPSPSPSPSPPRSTTPSPSRSPSVLPDPSSTPGLCGSSPLLSFLSSFTLPGQSGPFYKAQVKMLIELKCPVLHVNFNHILDTDADLALTVFEGRESTWIRRAVTLFLRDNGLATEHGNISFSNLPKSCKRARSALATPDVPLVWPNTICKGAAEVVSASFYGSQSFSAITSSVFKRLKNGESFCGKLTLDDFLLIEDDREMRALIIKEPEISENASGDDKALDVHAVWPMMEPFFAWGGTLPMYFEELKLDLLGATAEDVNQDWFPEFIIYHPALMPSLARRYFENGLCQVLRQSSFHTSDGLNDILHEALVPDWRERARGDDILGPVYGYEKQKAMQSSSKESEAQKAADLTAENKDQNDKPEDGQTKEGHGKKLLSQEDLAQGSEVSKHEEEDEVAEQEPYDNTGLDLLAFKRKNNEHPKISASDFDETEMYTANRCGGYLPNAIKVLLKECDMSGKLAGLWSLYKSLKSCSRLLSPC